MAHLVVRINTVPLDNNDISKTLSQFSCVILHHMHKSTCLIVFLFYLSLDNFDPNDLSDHYDVLFALVDKGI